MANRKETTARLRTIEEGNKPIIVRVKGNLWTCLKRRERRARIVNGYRKGLEV
ncbi:MAG: hypothetical protein NTV58_15040 [Deltaproteobacteria bacterium]|nr:hypothetical protein [Deltaproteobacteria bacterium]